MKLFIIVVMLNLAAVAPAQQRKSRLVRGTRISKPQPTVYIRFVRFGKHEPRHVDESDKGVWLRVYNNTRWPLIFKGIGPFPPGGDEQASMFYGVEEVPKSIDEVMIEPVVKAQPVPFHSYEQQSPPKMQPSVAPPEAKDEVTEECKAPPDDWCRHLCSSVTLPPGKSLVFSVPRETLCKNLKIYLRYNYSWEKHYKYRPFDYEPEHRVYYEGADLPKAAR